MTLLLFIVVYVIVGSICLAIETSKPPMDQGLLARKNKAAFVLIWPVWLLR